MWNKESHDFGQVKVGEKLVTDFVYQGSENYTISDFRKSCTCTSMLWDKTKNTLTVELRNDSPGYHASSINVKGVNLVFKANSK